MTVYSIRLNAPGISNSDSPCPNGHIKQDSPRAIQYRIPTRRKPMTKTEVAHEERSEEPHILAVRGWKAVPIAEAVCMKKKKKNQIER